MIAIIDSRTANLGSLVNIFRHLGLPACVAATPAQLRGAERIVLPGIGHFDTCARNLRSSGFASALRDLVSGDTGLPLLGICVGAQLLTRGSEEGCELGLGWIDATTRRFPPPKIDEYKIPHMGWNLAHPARPHPLFDSFEQTVPRFYFVHSYCMQCDNPKHSLARTRHGIDFDSAVGRDRVTGVQFHPEKSHRFGMKLLASFARWNPVIEGAGC